MRIDRVKLIATAARKEMTVGQLSEKSGVSKPTITSIRGGKSCRYETSVALAAALGVKVEDLLED